MPRKGENIYKRKDGRWEGRYIKYHDHENRAKYGYVYAHTYAEVKEKLKSLKSKDFSENKNSINMYMRQYSVAWLSENKHNFKASTFAKYSNIVNNHINRKLGDYLISDITTNIVNGFISYELEGGNLNTCAGLSTKTVKDIISVLRLILNNAEHSLKTKNNCNFDLIHIRTDIKNIESISKSQQFVLTNYLMKDIDYIKLGVLLCLYTGMRIGELCAIKIEDISIQEKTIRIEKTMQRIQNFTDSNNKTSVVITTPKSLCSKRVIPLPNFLAVIISNMNFAPNSYLLTGVQNKFVEPRTMENRFKTILTECGMKNISFHQLRHRFATSYIELGFDVKTLSEILGHSNASITLNRYVHSSIDIERENMNKLQECYIYSPSE